MGYSTDPSMVEVNIFKPSGKWYITLAVKWLTWSGQSDKSDPKTIVLIHEAFAEALRNNLTANKLMSEGMFAVCFEPYHEHAHPIILWDLNAEKPYSRKV